MTELDPKKIAEMRKILETTSKRLQDDSKKLEEKLRKYDYELKRLNLEVRNGEKKVEDANVLLNRTKGERDAILLEQKEAQQMLDEYKRNLRIIKSDIEDFERRK